MFSGYIYSIGNNKLRNILPLTQMKLMKHGRQNIFRSILQGLIFLIYLYTTSSAQTKDTPVFVPDRPGFATPPDLISQQVFEVEEGIQYESSTDGIIRNKNIQLSSVLLRYGLFEKAEIRIQTDYAYNIKDGVIHSTIYGFDPVTIGTKIKVIEQKGVMPNFSLLFKLTMPFLGKAEFRPDNTAPSIYLLFSNDLSESVNLCYNYGMGWDGSSTIPTHFCAVCLGVNLNDEISTFVESYGYLNQTTKPKLYIDAGFAYLITEHLQIDLTAAGYLNSFKDYYLFSTGFAWEIGR
jgi:hypothetical protein